MSEEICIVTTVYVSGNGEEPTLQVVPDEQAALAYIQANIQALLAEYGWSEAEISERYQKSWDNLDDLIVTWNYSDDYRHFFFNRISTKYSGKTQPSSLKEFYPGVNR